MRVHSGLARGVPLKTVPDMNTRPILDRIKKSLFSILDSATLLQDARVADFYAGTGTQGIEALSWGAESCLFVEKRPDAVILLKENLTKTKLDSKAEVRCGEVSSVIQDKLSRISIHENERFDLILYDPPCVFSADASSRAACEMEMSLAGRLLFPRHARLVLRFEKRAEPPKPQGLELVRQWTDGPHAFAFYGVENRGV
jgi:16S rRNA (guanine(966)-N(2))-methyltransferase RsmD